MRWKRWHKTQRSKNTLPSLRAFLNGTGVLPGSTGLRRGVLHNSLRSRLDSVTFLFTVSQKKKKPLSPFRLCTRGSSLMFWLAMTWPMPLASWWLCAPLLIWAVRRSAALAGTCMATGSRTTAFGHGCRLAAWKRASGPRQTCVSAAVAALWPIHRRGHNFVESFCGRLCTHCQQLERSARGEVFGCLRRACARRCALCPAWFTDLWPGGMVASVLSCDWLVCLGDLHVLRMFFSLRETPPIVAALALSPILDGLQEKGEEM